MLRSLLLKASESVWLREHAVRTAFVRRATRRFMPGEEAEDMLRAAQTLAGQGLTSVFTRLGENVTDLREARAVTTHYLDTINRVRQVGLDCEPSIKLTQLGLDIDRPRAIAHAREIAARANEDGSFLWVDMEQSPYVDATLDITEELCRSFPAVGVCLQAYLHRTKADLERMLNLGAGVRLVKGAYREPPAIAIAQKSDVDANYVALAQRMLESGPPKRPRVVFGTHDMTIVEKIRHHARNKKLPPDRYEFHMLYGIQRGAQIDLAKAGETVRVLIAYGSYWFPWYMRRLAERPANLWFVAKSMFKR